MTSTDQPGQAPEGQSGFASGAARSPVLRLLGSARLFVLFAVVGLFVSAVTLLAYGGLLAVKTAWETIDQATIDEAGLQHLTIMFIKLTDAFLLGCVLVIVGLGLYQLFINPRVPLPPWLRVTTLDHLKALLLSVVVVLIGVSFVGIVVDWSGTGQILDLGLASAAVILAISVFLAIARHAESAEEEGHG